MRRIGWYLLIQNASSIDNCNSQLETSRIVNMLGLYIYLPTPPLGQDMTQGQFLSGV